MIWTIIGYGKTYLDKCSRDHIGAYAAQAAYFMIMSAIPFAMLLFAMFSFTPSIMDYFNQLLVESLPGELIPYIDPVLEALSEASVGVISISAIMAIWSSGKAFQNLMVGLNVVNQIRETRNWFVTRFWAVIYTLLLLVAIAVIMLMLVFTQQLQEFFSNYYGFLAYVVGIRPLFRFIFVYFFLIVVFTCLFKWLPNMKLTFISQLPGGIICATMWYIFSAFLAVWIKLFRGFSMYGALAIVMIIMFWLYFCMYFMLMAAEANKFFEYAFGLAARKLWQKIKENRLAKTINDTISDNFSDKDE